MSEEEKILKTIRYCANDYMKQEDGIQCFEWEDLWVLNEYIENIKQENKQFKEKINTYENPEDLTLMFMYCDEKAKDKIKQLKDKLKGVQEERDYLFNKTSVENKYLQQERDKYKKVIEEVREYINSNPNVFYDEYLIDVETLKNNECIDDTVGEIKFISNLLQILDKAKEN